MHINLAHKALHQQSPEYLNELFNIYVTPKKLQSEKKYLPRKSMVKENSQCQGQLYRIDCHLQYDKQKENCTCMYKNRYIAMPDHVKLPLIMAVTTTIIYLVIYNAHIKDTDLSVLPLEDPGR